MALTLLTTVTLGWLKVAVVGFMILVALFVVIFQPDHSPHDHNWTLGWVGLWENSDWTWAVFATSLFKVFYYYAGLKNVNYILNDVKDPVRTLKAVSITVLLTTCVLYALINITYFVVPFDEIKQSGELIAALFFERSLGPSLGKVILPVVVTLSNVGNVMVTVYALVSVTTTCIVKRADQIRNRDGSTKRSLVKDSSHSPTF